MLPFTILAIAIAGIATVGAALSGVLMSRVAEPKFTVLQSEDNIQIRQYEPIVVAEVEVDGERYKAINQGFRILAAYIFGENNSGEKLAMTAPVSQQSGRKIAMTAPVTQQADNHSWKVRFVMPEKEAIATLPTPNNPQIQLIAVPAKRFAVIRFSGFNTDRNLHEHRKALSSYIAKHQLGTVGEATSAFYNPPWTLPFLRRNEIMMELL